MTLQPVTIDGQLYFYGFVGGRNATTTHIGIGFIRLVGNGTGTDYTAVEIYDGGWQEVATTGDAEWDSGTYFPDFISGLNASAPKFLENNELWFTLLKGPKDCTPSGTGPWFNNFSGEDEGSDDRIAVATMTISSIDTQPPSVGAEDVLCSSVREMGAGYEVSRITPMPLATGSPRLLYSASNDDNFNPTDNTYCGSPPDPADNIFHGMSVVVTSFTY